jgi:prophage regulatory protein
MAILKSNGNNGMILPIAADYLEYAMHTILRRCNIRTLRNMSKEAAAATTITNGMPSGTVCEADTDGDSTRADGAPPAAASDDDDGGESDGEPARPRPRSNARRAAAPLPPFRPTLLGFAPLAHDTGMCRSRIYQLIRESGFPPPIKVGKSSRWLTAEVDQWIAAQAAARQTQQSAG